MAKGAMDICLRLLKESKKGRFYSCSVRSSILIISHITFGDCHLHIFSDNHSRNSCRVFSLTWPASIQIFWNKRKRLHKKGVQLPQDWFGTPTWPPFHCFGTPIWPLGRLVKTLFFVKPALGTLHSSDR